jgi:hypothetical protein
MTDPKRFEDALRQGLRDSAAPVVADDELQRRLIAAAGSVKQQPPRRSGSFPAGWLLPLAAAVITALCVGSVVLVSQERHSSGVVTGNGTSIPRPTSFAPPTPTPTTSSAAAAPTRTATPSHHSSPAPTTVAPRASTVTTPQHRPSTSPRPTKTTHAVPAACTAAPHGTSNPTTLAEFKSRITRTWLLCSAPSVFASNDAGLQITSDGHWSKLVRDKAGRLVTGSGLHDGGTWQALDDSAMNGRPVFQLNLMTGNGTYILMADFAAAVERVRLDNNGTYVADYVPTTEQVLPG